MKLRILLLACGVVLPFGAQAAEITRIASSFEDDDPFGMYFDIGFERTQTKYKITQERHSGGATQEVDAMHYVGIDARLNLDLRLGLWHDLELRFGMPIVFQQSRRWGFAGPTNASNSTIYANCIDARGNVLDPACATAGTGAQPIFELPAESQRGGIDNLTFGLAYAFFNQKKDPTKPTWIVGLDYRAPTAEQLNPSQPTSPSVRGELGDRVHRYKLFTSLSRQIGVADPYFHFSWSIPYRGPGWYSNCDNPDPSRMGYPENCNTANWSRSDTGIEPPAVLNMMFGSEFKVKEDLVKKTSFSLDLRTIATYVGPGRYYNEMSDLVGKLLATEDYLQIGGTVRIVAFPAEYAKFTAGVTLLYNTSHTLTNEQLGKDVNGDGSVDPSDPLEINPNFDFRTDLPGRRFRGTEGVTFGLDLGVSFTF
jgi:hypothetical protein